MENEFIALEEKVKQIVNLCEVLRLENRVLRDKVNAAQSERNLLLGTLQQSKQRLNLLLDKLPKDEHGN